MRRKPYLECPFCGCQVTTIEKRINDSVKVRNVYDCKKCNKKLGVPYWCLWLELFINAAVMFFLLCAFKRFFPPGLQKIWQGEMSLPMLGMIVLAFPVLIWIHKKTATFFSYLVPLKEIEPFDYGDYSMVSRHKGNDSDEQE